VAVGRSGPRHTARDAEAILAREWAALAVVDTGPLYAAAAADHGRYAEVLARTVVMTLDRRDFGVVRPRYRRAFQLLP
jgi:hypothetical protein